jgi:menaquinone-dependent protoporphyrinogen oxidase
MTRYLVTYATNAGSTVEVAEAISRILAECGSQVDLRRVEDVEGLTAYDVVVVGAPMILGWHRSAVRFLKKHRAALAGKQVACFSTLMSLTQTAPPADLTVQVSVDPWLLKPPQNVGRLSLKERYATLGNYMRPMLSAAPAVRPLQVAFFGGKLELFRLKWWQLLFVMVIIQAPPGDFRNWEFIETWAKGLREAVEGDRVIE